MDLYFLWKEWFVPGIAVFGVLLGAWNTYHSYRKEIVKLKITFQPALVRGSGFKRMRGEFKDFPAMVIQITNRSASDVYIQYIEFVETDSGVEIEPMGIQFPILLKPRGSYNLNRFTAKGWTNKHIAKTNCNSIIVTTTCDTIERQKLPEEIAVEIFHPNLPPF